MTDTGIAVEAFSNPLYSSPVPFFLPSATAPTGAIPLVALSSKVLVGGTNSHMTEEELKAQLDAVYASTSWKVTAPLRWIGTLVYRTKEFAQHPRRFLNALFGKAVRNLKVRRMAVKLLQPFPFLHDPIRRKALMHIQNPVLPDAVAYSVKKEEITLSRQAREVLGELRTAVQRKGRAD